VQATPKDNQPKQQAVASDDHGSSKTKKGTRVKKMKKKYVLLFLNSPYHEVLLDKLTWIFFLFVIVVFWTPFPRKPQNAIKPKKSKKK
jgi:hypothetical protein